MMSWFPYADMKSEGETLPQFSMRKSMNRTLNVHQSINNHNYEFVISPTKTILLESVLAMGRYGPATVCIDGFNRLTTFDSDMT